MTPKPSNAYERILATASLFYQKGIQHVGINEVIANSDVAKRTFYKHFLQRQAYSGSHALSRKAMVAVV